MNDTTIAPRPLPVTIPDYLAQLRQALEGADPALVQDALYDAEEYLRSELAEQSGRPEAEVIAAVAGSYGAPEEVAQIYRDTEVTVNRALRGPSSLPLRIPAIAPDAGERSHATAAPQPPPAPGITRLLFGVFTDPVTYGALVYMLLSLVTGIFYFTWVVTGASLSLGLLILIIGVPLLVLFFASVRVLALVEGRLVETLLGMRMPRRPPYTEHDQPWLKRIGAMFIDPRTWSTMAYFLLMLPLGVAYFTIAVTGLSLSLSTLLAPLLSLLGNDIGGLWINGTDLLTRPWTWPLLSMCGAVLLVITLHLARGIGRLHAQLAKHLLVRGG
jgi:hypothetical protein